ncbi:MAG TPA: Wzz/FepE/Etk N-terminal domain-containing protein [Aromatoleum sp.]|uniref:Wzz/FepE/Etk N-terminal domain-containing protein n=1 Tax=Aromatoleum sp. TaxID=2307007 RepID=UPI002B48488E|nr:Wzz/FepE/Etk N-terminal domain-containing protein [Aromatoleum sp.]HJV25096.1 Wzz/FepE/Etk N-terminal domain-containing protein [Aromatoleum sp.]
MSDRNTSATHVDDELSFFELWEILVRRKSWVVVTLGLCLLSAVVYLFVATPIFEVHAALRIGQVADSGGLEDPEVLTTSLMGKYGEEVSTGVKRPLPFLKSAALQRNSKQVIELAVHGATPEQSAEFMKRVVDDVIARHGVIFKSEVDLARRRIDQIEAQRRLLNGLFIGSNDLFETLKKKDVVQASLLTQERARIAAELSSVERELPAWLQKMNAPRTVMTELTSDVVAPARPSSPRKIMTLALAVLLGISGGVTLAFVAEFVAKARARAAV